ncbi:hypothetical protein MtrunA17_Chr7g0243101 [Medicago truncatula]|uniref:Uncharacterized protein n=1 Tax=Medicago truncatula TaxID=3880 RepID=A0A396H216_MEDTR|nr:hypothetical protein MtrunA17_Chr7g0243101 [Medicago truncatula]
MKQGRGGFNNRGGAGCVKPAPPRCHVYLWVGGYGLHVYLRLNCTFGPLSFQKFMFCI